MLVDTGSARLLLDPGAFSDGFSDVRDLAGILITHQHFDHLDTERLPALVRANPDATLIVDSGSVEEVEKLGLRATVANPGDSMNLGGAAVNVVGGKHALIYADLPTVPNVGYVIDHGAFYHPGDSLFVPEQRVDVLGVPTSAPWLKTNEAIDFTRAVAPRVAVPIHQELFNDRGKQLTYNWIERFSPEGTTLRVLTPREPEEL